MSSKAEEYILFQLIRILSKENLNGVRDYRNVTGRPRNAYQTVHGPDGFDYKNDQPLPVSTGF